MNVVRWRAAVLVCSVFVCALGGLLLARQAPAGPAYKLEPTKYGMQLKTPDGRVVLEYLTKKPEGSPLTSPSVACFHPVNTPTGETVTAFAPDDHPHHRGIFFGWHDSEFRAPVNLDTYGPNKPLRALNITKADFWGWGSFATREDRVVETRDVKLVRADAAHAALEIRNDWTVRSRKMLDEVNTAIVTERDGVYVLDLEYRLTPTVEYVLNRASFGGFDVQGRKDGESWFSSAKGKLDLPDAHYSLPDLNWPPEPWYDFSIRLKASGKVIGFAVIDHPSNPYTTWHNSSHLWMLNPVITAGGPFTIPGGHTLRLRYRVVVHDGDAPTQLLEKLSAEWRKM
jgi:hypothetical protein